MFQCWVWIFRTEVGRVRTKFSVPRVEFLRFQSWVGSAQNWRLFLISNQLRVFRGLDTLLCWRLFPISDVIKGSFVVSMSWRRLFHVSDVMLRTLCAFDAVLTTLSCIWCNFEDLPNPRWHFCVSDVILGIFRALDIMVFSHFHKLSNITCKL